MYPIVRKEVLADQIVLMEVKAPMVARKCQRIESIVFYWERNLKGNISFLTKYHA